jgi:hypothetical protein
MSTLRDLTPMVTPPVANASLGGATAHNPDLLGWTVQARGCATHSGRAAKLPRRAQWELEVRA